MFVQWVTTYHDVLTNLMPEDRAEALRYLDDDNQFDAWLSRFGSKQNGSSAKAAKPGQRKVSKGDFLKTMDSFMPPPING